jgi:hypothetical protein
MSIMHRIAVGVWLLIASVGIVDAALSAAWVPVTTSPTAPAFTNSSPGDYPYGRYLHWAVPTSDTTFAFGFGQNFQWTTRKILSDIWNVSVTHSSATLNRIVNSSEVRLAFRFRSQLIKKFQVSHFPGFRSSRCHGPV